MKASLKAIFLDADDLTKTQWKGASEYDFDNDVKIGDALTTKKLYVNDVEITPSAGGVSAGLLRAINCNQIVPTVAQTFNVVWSSLSPAEQAIWAGGSEPPVASVDNRWNFTKLSAGTQKINWTIPFDFLTNLIPKEITILISITILTITIIISILIIKIIITIFTLKFVINRIIILII